MRRITRATRRIWGSWRRCSLSSLRTTDLTGANRSGPTDPYVYLTLYFFKQGSFRSFFILFFFLAIFTTFLYFLFSSAGHDAITSASRVKRKALVGARSSPFLVQAVSTAGSPIPLAGRASCAAAVALRHVAGCRHCKSHNRKRASS